MEDTSIIVSFIGGMVFWVLVAAGVLIAGWWWKWARAFRTTMIQQWRPSLVIAILFLVSMGLGGKGFRNLWGVAIFCQALVGFALARSIAGYEPLPVTRSVARRDHVLRNAGMMLVIAVLLIPLPMIVSVVGSGIGRSIFGEMALTGQSVAGAFPSESWRILFLMLAGAGVAEETPYRLVILSFLWRLTRRRWLAIILSAVIFGAYHLTPLNTMYGVYWKAPISQLLTSTLGGLVMGYVYTKRGYETVVLGHTLGNWILFSLFAAG